MNNQKTELIKLFDKITKQERDEAIKELDERLLEAKEEFLEYIDLNSDQISELLETAKKSIKLEKQKKKDIIEAEKVLEKIL